MIYKDRVYGKIKISEPVILDIISCPSLQRLKKISQWGYPKHFYPKATHSRFDHSIGVYLLLKKFKAPLEEQIAGLIHDVSHAAFSHIIDYILDSGSQTHHTHQDNIFKKFVNKTDLPAILKKYGYKPNYITNDKNFPLKESNLPNLCADRIDYLLRDTVVIGELTRKKAQYFLNNLHIHNKKWVFKKLDAAQSFTQLFLKMNTQYYSSIETTVVFRTVGDYLKLALEEKYISRQDLYTTDKVILNKVRKFHPKDKKLKLLFNRMENKVPFKNNPNSSSCLHTFCKSRMVNPLVLDKQSVKRLSKINPVWKKIISKELNPKEYFLEFLD